MLVLFLTLLTVTTASNSGTQLNYNEQDHWDGVCTTGEAQSPIDVPAPVNTAKLTGRIPFLTLPQNNFLMTNENNPNTVKYAVNPYGSRARVPWMDNRKVSLHQLHLHWGATAARGSEHLIKGRAFSAEAHLVTSYTASDWTTKYMVFARVFVVGRANPLIDQMIEGNQEHGNRNIEEFDLSALYPAYEEEWLTYQGGLTTPPCSEIVHWVIVRKPLTISENQLEQLRRMPLGSGHMAALTRNWRNKQDLNGRKSTIYYRG